MSPTKGAEVVMALLSHPGALLPVTLWGGGLPQETQSQNYVTRLRFLTLRGQGPP